MSRTHEEVVNEAMLLLEWGSVMQGSVLSRVEWAISRAQTEEGAIEDIETWSNSLAESIGLVVHGDPGDTFYGTDGYRAAKRARAFADVREGRSPRAEPAAPGQDAHAFVRLATVERALDRIGAHSTAYVPSFHSESELPGAHDIHALPDDATPEQADWWRRGYAQAIIDARDQIAEEIEEEELNA